MKDYSFKRIVKPYGWIGHLPFAIQLIKQKKPEVLVELGTHTGNSFCGFCQCISENKISTKAFAVDTWEGDFQAGSYNDSVYKEISRYVNSNFPFASLMKMTFDDALEKFDNSSIDILHIDGLHTYEAVKHDFETWLPKMKNDGVILFHDIAEKKEDFGVYLLWEQLKEKYQTLEFEHNHGLGILFLEPQSKNTLFPFFDDKKKEIEATGLNLWYFYETKELERSLFDVKNSLAYKFGEFTSKPFRQMKSWRRKKN